MKISTCEACGDGVLCKFYQHDDLMRQPKYCPIDRDDANWKPEEIKEVPDEGK